MSTDTVTAAATDTVRPMSAATAEQAERVPWLRGVAWPLARRTLIALWRHLLTLYVVARLGLVWAAFCAATHLADTHARTDRETGRTTIRIRHVPRLDRIEIGPHGATLRVKLRPGQDLRTYTALAAALRHTARCQAASAAEIEEEPGYLQLRLLRRDPLHRVIDLPHEIAPGVLAIGLTETGQPWLIDLTGVPHWVVSGATGSGKSAIQAAILAALAPTDAALILWDLKFGLEAEPWRARATDIAAKPEQVTASCTRLLDLAERRAAGFRRLQVGSVEEAAAAGVTLRRVVVICDEIAELTLADDHAINELLRVVQLVRALGIHVILAGQRFGSDLGKKITAVRAQVGGRVCARVNDIETARMVLSALDDDAHRRALTVPRPGQVIVQTDAEWHYARATYLGSAERRAVAARHAEQNLSWEQLLAADAAALPPAPIPAPAVRLDH